MNQSNKALTEAAIRKLRNADYAKCYEPAWHRDTADILIALITNHIKGALPDERVEQDEETMPYAAGQANGWNDYRNIVHQLLEEVSNADQ